VWAARDGFLRLRCDDCGHDRVVAFSCKERGTCPSCAGRTWEKRDFGSYDIDFAHRNEVLAGLKLQWDTSKRGVVPLGEGGRGDRAALRALSFRLVVRDTFTGVKRGRTTVTGRVVSGSVRVGDTIEMVVDGVPTPTEVTGLERYRQLVDEVAAGEEVAIEFDDSDCRWIKRGDELRAVSKQRE